MIKQTGRLYGEHAANDTHHDDHVISYDVSADYIAGGEEAYHGDFGIGRMVLDDGDVIFVGGSYGSQEASVDGQGGMLRNNPVYTVEQAAVQLNRGAGVQTDGVNFYNSGANWAGAQGTANNDWYFLPTSKTNGGEANDAATQFRLTGSTTAGPTGPLTQLNYGFYETLATLPDPYVFTRASDGTNALYIGDARANGFSPLSEAQRAATREAMQSWDDLTAIKFVETHFSQGDINLMNTTTGPAQASAFLPYGSSTTSVIIQDDGSRVTTYERVGDVFIATPSVNASNGALDEGQYGLTTLVHEIGHSLGLEHPGNYNFAPGFAVTYDNGADYYQDSNMYTIMSYWDAEETGAHYVDWQFLNYNYAATPMIHDVAAIQRIYGADMTTRTGDTTYGFNASADTAGRDAFDFVKTPLPVMTIWDAGGNDTLDLSGFNTPSIVDLNPGAYSSAGGFLTATIPTLAEINARRVADGRPERTQATYDYYVATFGKGFGNGLLTDNIGIAYGATIENAKGGAGNDIMSGNLADNGLFGNAGNDTLSGKEGNDLLDGGIGSDAMTGGTGNDLYIVDNGGDLVAELANEGTDTVRSSIDYTLVAEVENLILTDGARSGTGNGLANTLTGNALGNQLNGGAGKDVLIGGDGVDFLTGGAGADRFVAEINTTKTASKDGPISLDVITDFQKGSDVIDLSGIDANSNVAGHQAFNFVGHSSGKNAGDLSVKTFGNMNAAEKALGMEIDGVDGGGQGSGPVTVVFGNTDGGAADFALVLLNTQSVTQTDFLFG